MEITFKIDDVFSSRICIFKVDKKLYNLIYGYKIVDVNRELMQEIFSLAKDMPKDFFVNGIVNDKDSLCLNVYITSNSFEIVKEFEKLPIREAWFDYDDLKNLDLSKHTKHTNPEY